MHLLDSTEEAEEPILAEGVEVLGTQVLTLQAIPLAMVVQAYVLFDTLYRRF